MKRPGFPSKLVCLLLVMMGSAFSQQITVQNDQSSPVVLSAADIAALPHTTVKVNGHDGPASFSGVPVSTLLEKAGITFGESLRGKRLASCLLVEAADGYRVVIALPELDQVSRTNRYFWWTNAKHIHWTIKKGPIGSSFLTKKEWQGGCDR